RAGLARGVRRRAARGVARPPQRLDLGMRPPARLGPPAPDHYGVLHHHRTDRWVRPGIAEPAPPQVQRERHEACTDIRTHSGHLLFALSKKRNDIPVAFDHIYDFDDLANIAKEDEVVSIGGAANVGEQIRPSP